MLTKDSADQPRRVLRPGLGTTAVAASVFECRDVWQHQGRYGRVAAVHLARRAPLGSDRWRIENTIWLAMSMRFLLLQRVANDRISELFPDLDRGMARQVHSFKG